MAKLARSAFMVALVFGTPTAAYARVVKSPHLHAPQSATAVQLAPARPQQNANHMDRCQCPCCQPMQTMKQSGDAGCMQKMKMMQGQGAQEKPASPQEHEKHELERSSWRLTERLSAPT